MKSSRMASDFPFSPGLPTDRNGPGAKNCLKGLFPIACLLLLLFFAAGAAAQSPSMLLLNQRAKADEKAAAGRQTVATADETAGDVSPEDPEAAGKKKRRWLVKLFFSAESAASQLGERIDFLASGVRETPEEIRMATHSFLGEKGLPGLREMSIFVVLIIVLGIFLEKLLKLRLKDLYDKIETVPPSGVFHKLWRVLIRLALDILLVGVYVLATFVAFTLAFEQGTNPYFLAAVILLYTYYLKLIAVLLKLLFSPKTTELRLAPLQDADARTVSGWIMLICAAGIGLGAIAAMYRNFGVSEAVYLVLYNIAGIAVVFLIVLMIWSARRRVTSLIRANYNEKQETVTPLAEKMAEIWYFPAILYTLLIGVFWQVGVLLENDNLVNRLIVSFLCAPAYIMLDQWGQKLLSVSFRRVTVPLSEEPATRPAEVEKIAAPENFDAATAKKKTVEGETDEDEDETDDWDDDKKKPLPNIRELASPSYIEKKLPFIRKLFRFMLAGLMLFTVLRLWGVDWTFGRAFTQAAMGILVSLALAYLVWEFARSYIDKKLEEEHFFDSEEMEEGGAGGSRLGTLLFLLKKFIMALLVVIVTMTILSSIGVDIGPLIAGAGILGIAIGFGAQTLVKDIISGIFFLIDDAFRVGDYVNTGSLKGMVEHISLRSLRLRHHRGPVHTIPFSSLKSVTNMSRDYIIEKLSFRVKYDTDVEKVRKIVKKINKAVSKDSELGPNLLGKIKSQGVRELDDSAMIMRVKFKCIPGEQFMIRREVFRMMQEKFREAGIEFAHKNVTVYLPPEESAKAGENGKKIEERVARAAGAAALAAEQEELEQQQAQAPKKQ